MNDETSTAPARDPREIDWPLTFPLATIVQAHGENISALTLREPTGDDVLKFGLLDGLDASQFFPLVTKLAQVPELTLKQMAARDILRLGTVLSRFFTWAAQPPA